MSLRGMSCIFSVPDIWKAAKYYVEKGVTFVQHLNVTDYQNKKFVIEDIDGRWLALCLKIKEDGE